MPAEEMCIDGQPTRAQKCNSHLNGGDEQGMGKEIDRRRSGCNPGKGDTRADYGKRRCCERRQKAGQHQYPCPNLNPGKQHFRPSDRRTISYSLGNRE